MNVAFWFMLAWGVFGLLRTPNRERSGILFSHRNRGTLYGAHLRRDSALCLERIRRLRREIV